MTAFLVAIAAVAAVSVVFIVMLAMKRPAPFDPLPLEKYIQAAQDDRDADVAAEDARARGEINTAIAEAEDAIADPKLEDVDEQLGEVRDFMRGQS